MMAAATPPDSSNAYTVAWIAALSHERAAGEAMFDETRKGPPPGFQKNVSDPNAYSWGRIGKHNVVLAALPVGEYGTNATAIIAQGLRSSLPHIRIGLLVGIGAGVPGEQRGKDGTIQVQRDIRLGDVAVSVPDGTSGGVVQVDFVKAKEVDGEEILELKGHLNSPPMAIRTALSKLQADHELRDSRIPELFEQAFQKYPKMKTRYGHPGLVGQEQGAKVDVYHAQDGTEIKRESRLTPEIHYGVIASGNTLEKLARHRDALLARLRKDRIEPICFEMEAAGLMNSFPCLVIRGICDYADERKNDDWQRYAAATAAAFGKEFLETVDAEEVEKGRGLGEILEQIESMHSGVRELRAHTRTQQQNAVLEWLCPNDYSQQYADYLKRRLPETGTWLLKEAKFVEWVNYEDSCALFCHGGPGTGKTILSAIVIEYLLDHKLGPNDAILYLFCNYKQREEQTLDHFIASLLRQLAASSAQTFKAMEELYNSCKVKKKEPTRQDLDSYFEAALRTVSNVYIVIDALDECQPHVGKGLVRKLRETKSTNNVRVLATARDVEEIRMWFSTDPSLSITASRNDMERYVEYEMAQFEESIQQNEELRKSIIEGVVGVADGMFLLAVLHMESLKYQLTPNDVKNTLRGLRSGHEAYGAAYEAAMDRIGSQHPNRRNLALRIFAWIVHAKRPLELLELQHALATRLGKRELDPGDFVDSTIALSVCAGLVKHDEQSRAVRLVHYTTQEYFEKTWARWFESESIAIADTCITYLSFDAFTTSPSKETYRMYALSGQYALLEYAAQHWGDHVRDREAFWDSHDMQYPSMSDALMSFLQHEDIILSATGAMPVWLYLQNDYLSRSDTSAIHLAAHFGAIQPARFLIGLGGNVNTADSDGRCPLWYAAANGHIAMVRLLLDNGANINALSKTYSTALTAASKTGYVEVLHPLLRKGADLNAQAGLESNALYAASCNGHVEVLRLLLDKVTKINTQRIIYRQALETASVRGYVEVVLLLLGKAADIDAWSNALCFALSGGRIRVALSLLDNGAHINTQDAISSKALILASARGYVQAVLLILDQGVDINALANDDDSMYGTALQAASKKGHVGVVQILLEKGANVNAQGGTYGNALCAASYFGKQEIVQLLLSGGAEIDRVGGKHGTALQVASHEGHEAVVRILLDQGSNANIKGGEYGSALRACLLSNGRIVRMLLDNGADDTEREEYREAAVAAFVHFRRKRKNCVPRNS